MKNKPLLVLFLTIFLDLLGFGIIIPVFPIIAKELNASAIEIGFIAGIYSLMNFLFSPFWGTLSDRIGRRPVMLISIALTVLAYVFFAFTNSLVFLILSRVFAGIGSANISAAQAYIADITPPENRAKNMGFIGAAFGLGFIFGPPIGGFLKSMSGTGSVEYVGWFSAILSSINLILAFLFLKESLQQKQKDKAYSFKPIANLVEEFKKPVIRELILFNFIFIVAFAMMQISSTIFWAEKFGFNEKQIGWVFMYIGVLSAIIQGGLVGKLNKYFGEKQLLTYGTIFMVIGLGTLPFTPVDIFWLQLVSLFFIALANGFISPAILALLSKNTLAHQQGQVLGSNQSFGSLARVIGPALGGLLYSLDWGFPFWGGALLMGLCFFLISAIWKFTEAKL
jgi:multidrug resistance protein